MALKLSLFVAVAVLVGGIAMGFYYSIGVEETMQKSSISSVVLGTTTVTVEVANTESTREQGLSGRTSLATGTGMLFVFDQPGNYGFWMKDMGFALDILFLNASGTVLTIHKDATPESYRKVPPVVFYPTAPAMYVLEVPAGYTTEKGIVEEMHAELK